MPCQNTLVDCKKYLQNSQCQHITVIIIEVMYSIKNHSYLRIYYLNSADERRDQISAQQSQG